MNNAPTFLAVYGSYQSLELALYQQNICVTQHIESKARASSVLIPLINDLLVKNNLTLKHLDFIALDAGPGAFTSLRVIISSINGIAYASKIPLVSVDGLEALAQTTFSEKIIHPETILICLLNAYNQEVYIAEFKMNKNQLIKVTDPFYGQISNVLEELNKKYQGKNIAFTGNGAQLQTELIKNYFGQEIEILSILHASVNTVAQYGLKSFLKNENLCSEIQPLYLKKALYATQN